MTRFNLITLLCLWFWGAGAVFATGEARRWFCGDEAESASIILSFAWPLAAVALTIEGGWGSAKVGCQ